MAQGQKIHDPFAKCVLQGTPKAGPSRGIWGCFPRKIFKILGARITLVAIFHL